MVLSGKTMIFGGITEGTRHIVGKAFCVFEKPDNQMSEIKVLVNGNNTPYSSE